jgi:hypothetical protein
VELIVALSLDEVLNQAVNNLSGTNSNIGPSNNEEVDFEEGCEVRLSGVENML